MILHPKHIWVKSEVTSPGNPKITKYEAAGFEIAGFDKYVSEKHYWDMMEKQTNVNYALTRKIDRYENPSDGRCIEIAALRAHVDKLNSLVNECKELVNTTGGEYLAAHIKERLTMHLMELGKK